MPDLNEMALFARVVQAGGFSAAARQLRLPKSTVSRKIAALEERLGARLLQRTTRKLGLTDAGRIYFQHSARVVAEIDEATQAMSRLQSEPRGLMRVTAPLSFAMLGPIVADFLEANPAVQVDLVCTDRTADLVEEGFDLAIRAGRLTDSSLVARPLGSMRRVLVASPGYCRRNGLPRAPAELGKRACLSFGSVTSPNAWALERGEERVEVRVAPRFTTNDLELLREVARAGLGIAWLPEFVCAPDLRAGRLRRVLPEWASAAAPVNAVYPTARYLTPKVGAFIELLRKRFDGGRATT